MKRFLPFFPLTALLITTMGVGPCGSTPLGSTSDGSVNGGSDSCTAFNVGTTYRMDCSTCTCTGNGAAKCVAIACVEAGTSPGSDGPPPITDATPPPDDGSHTCIYQGAPYRLGSTFPASDGCNNCSCTATGVVCTLIACAADGGPAARDARTVDGSVSDGPPVCFYGGKTYPPGANIPANDGCNTCGCTMDGAIFCTQRTCGLDASTDVAPPGPVCMPGANQTCNEDPTISSFVGTCLPDGTCKCPNAVSPYTGRCLDPGDSEGSGCEYAGVTHPLMSTFACNGCEICTCVGPGSVSSTPGTCTDAGATTCVDVPLPSSSTCVAAADLTAIASKDCASRGLTISSINLGDACDSTTFRSGHYSCCFTPPPALFNCGYDGTTCKVNEEYCVAAEANGANKLSLCRPYSPGCTTCACARLDAASTLDQVSACTGSAMSATCTDGTTTIQASDTSPTLSVWCMVP